MSKNYYAIRKDNNKQTFLKAAAGVRDARLRTLVGALAVFCMPTSHFASNGQGVHPHSMTSKAMARLLDSYGTELTLVDGKFLVLNKPEDWKIITDPAFIRDAAATLQTKRMDEERIISELIPQMNYRVAAANIAAISKITSPDQARYVLNDVGSMERVLKVEYLLHHSDRYLPA